MTLLPDGNAVSGWSRSKEPQVFGADNLWEFIDGAAETYLAFGFEEMAAAGYSHGTNLTANVEIYRMTDPRASFGVYALESSPKAEFLPVGTEGYLNSNVLNFWSGSYYVKITASPVGDHVAPSAALLRALADWMSGKIGPPTPPPAELLWFPPGHVVPHSERYVPKDVLGQSYLARAFEARYRDGAASYKLVVATFDTADAARDALARYQAFVAKEGKVRATLAAPGDGGFAGDEAYAGRLVAIRSGGRLLIVLGAPSDAAATGLIAESLKRTTAGSR